MIYTPEEEEIKTKEDFEKQLESIRNNITLNEAEVERLKKLQRSLEGVIKQKHNEHEYQKEENAKLEEEKKDLESKKAGYEIDIKEAKEELEELRDDIKKEEERFVEVQRKTSDEKGVYKVRLLKLDEREAKLKTREDQVTEQEKSQGEKELELAEKAAKIEAAREQIVKATEDL